MGRKKKFPYIVCKPCWELKYCPYGPLVEQFPLFPEMQEIEEVKSKYRTVLANLGNGKYKSEEEILSVMQILGGYSPSKWERIIDYDTVELGCNVFGHICPVFLTAEPFTETKEIRRVSRHIPRNVMLKVVRRDGHICQISISCLTNIDICQTRDGYLIDLPAMEAI